MYLLQDNLNISFSVSSSSVGNVHFPVLAMNVDFAVIPGLGIVDCLLSFPPSNVPMPIPVPYTGLMRHSGSAFPPNACSCSLSSLCGERLVSQKLFDLDTPWTDNVVVLVL